MSLFNQKKKFVLILTLISLFSGMGCSSDKRISLCGYSIEQFNFASSVDTYFEEEKLIRDLSDYGATIREQRAMPPKSIMKRQPTFRPKIRKNIYAEFSCGTNAKKIALFFSSTHIDYTIGKIRKFADEICEKDNAGLIAAFVQSGQENSAAEKIADEYGDGLYCLAAQAQGENDSQKMSFRQIIFDNENRNEKSDKIRQFFEDLKLRKNR